MARTGKKSPTISIEAENAVGNIDARGKARVSVKQSSVRQAPTDPQFEQLFKLVDEKIKARPEDPNVDKKEIREQVEQIKTEAAKGPAANETKLERWTKNLAAMAPDILDVILASLSGPVSGLTAVVKKVAAKAKAEQAGQAAAGS